MINRTLIALALLTAAPAISLAQHWTPPAGNGNIPQQSVYAEFGGNAIVYSLNYDVLFDNQWGIRLGGGYLPFDTSDDDHRSGAGEDAFLGLVMGFRTLGEKAHKLELGGGLVFGRIYNPASWQFSKPPAATFSIGYRYYPPKDSHVTFKVAFTPIINGSGIHPSLGVSIGITLTPEGDAHIR